MSGRRAVIRTESQRPCSIYHGLIRFPTSQYLVLITKRGSVHSIVDIGEKAAVLIGRRNELDFARLEWMVKQIMAHLEAFKLSINIPFTVCFKSLVVADLTPVVLADDADFSRRNRLSTGQRPASKLVTSLAVDHCFHHHGDFLLHRFGWDIFVGSYGRKRQGKEKKC